MRHLPLLTIMALLVLASSCGQQSRGHRHLTSADSLRRARAIAEEAHLHAAEELHEELAGPLQADSTGPVATAHGAPQVLHPGDSATTIVRAHERWHKRLAQALIDSTTPFGAMLTRVLVQDSAHRYATATYTSDGHLLAYHAEYTPDEHERYEYDLCFDRGSLLHVHERHIYAGDTEADDQAPDLYTDDMYYLTAGRAMYSYRTTGEIAHQMDHIEYMPRSRNALAGDIAGHLYHVFERFLSDYGVLQQQQMEMMVYTAQPQSTAEQ